MPEAIIHGVSRDHPRRRSGWGAATPPSRCVSCSRDWSARIFEGGIAIKTMPGWPAMPPGPRDCAAKRGAATRPSYAAQRVRDCDARTLSHSNLVTDFRHQSRISPPASRAAGRRFATTHASVTDLLVSRPRAGFLFDGHARRGDGETARDEADAQRRGCPVVQRQHRLEWCSRSSRLRHRLRHRCTSMTACGCLRQLVSNLQPISC